MDSKILGISLAVALLVGLVAFALFAEAGGRRIPATGATRRLSEADRIASFLRAARPPNWVRSRWGTVAVSHRLKHAGLPWVADDYAGLRWITAWLGLIAGVALAIARGWDLVGIFLGAVVVGVGWLGPPAWLAARVDRRQMEIDLSLPDFMDRLALVLEAGLGSKSRCVEPPPVTPVCWGRSCSAPFASSTEG